MKIEVQMRDGKVKMLTPAQARAMVFIGKGQYLTRNMEPAKASAALQAQPAAATLGDDGLDALHAIAKERGVQVHHAAGADKVRAALREAKAQ
jgi:hypothetical protein